LFQGSSAGYATPETLTITGSGTYNYAGTFVDGASSGSIYLTINGAGTQILSGTDSWSGPTVINSGALQIGAGGATGALGSATVTDDSLLTFDLSSSPTVPNSIQGTGQLDQIGTGTTTLTSNNNTYSGETFVSGGVLATATGSVISSGALVFSAASGATAAVSLGTSQSVSIITNTAAAGGSSRVGVASGLTLTSTGALTNTGTLNINTAGQAGGNVFVDHAPTLNTGSSIVVNAGMLEFNLPSSNPATIGSGVSVTVATPAVLELAGGSSALSNISGSSAANVNNNGSTASGGGFLVYGSSETVGNISGTAGTDVNGATVYSGDTTVGNGSTGANLTATEILQNSLTVAANSSVTIVPSSSGGGVVTSASDETAATSAASTSTAAVASSDSSSDPYDAIESVLSSSSTSADAASALRDIVHSTPGMKLSGADEVALYEDYQASSGTGVGASNPPSLLSDLAGDGLSSAEISSLTASASSSSFGIGSLSPAVYFGSSPTAVPEPSSLVLAALGAAGLAAMAIMRRRKFGRSAGSLVG
jgi:autotransporter-associated beta strand protein